MNNEMTRDILYHSLFGWESDEALDEELYHHGILGMHWGIRRYQPYGQGYDPKNKGRFVGSKQDAKNYKKLRKLQARADKAEAKRLKKATKVEKTKAELLASGNMDKILKNRKLFTNEELEAAQERADIAHARKVQKMIDKMNTATQVTSILAQNARNWNDIRTYLDRSKMQQIQVKDAKLGLISRQYDVQSKQTQAAQNALSYRKAREDYRNAKADRKTILERDKEQYRFDIKKRDTMYLEDREKFKQENWSRRINNRLKQQTYDMNRWKQTSGAKATGMAYDEIKRGGENVNEYMELAKLFLGSSGGNQQKKLK